MICPTRTPSQVLALSRRIAAQLAAEACDPDAGLTAADRRWLAGLSIAIEAEAARVASVESMTAEKVPKLDEGAGR